MTEQRPPNVATLLPVLAFLEEVIDRPFNRKASLALDALILAIEEKRP